MYRLQIFLSYHTPDEVLARGLETAVEACGDDVEVFFAPENLKAGSFWVPKLGEAIEQADALLLLPGERTGRWQLLECYDAFDRHVNDESFPPVPVISAGKAPRAWRYRLEDIVQWTISQLPRCLTAKERENFFRSGRSALVRKVQGAAKRKSTTMIAIWRRINGGNCCEYQSEGRRSR